MAKKGVDKVLSLKDGGKRNIGEDLLMRVYFYPDKIIIRRAFRDPDTGDFKEMGGKRDNPIFINPKGKTLDKIGRELVSKVLDPKLNRISRNYYSKKPERRE